MSRSNWARAPQLLSLRSGAREPRLLGPTRLEPVLRNWRGHYNEKPVHNNEGSPLPPPLAAIRESLRSNEDPMQPKRNKFKKKKRKKKEKIRETLSPITAFSLCLIYLMKFLTFGAGIISI